jgi:P-type Ca2+ transporter type 2C
LCFDGENLINLGAAAFYRHPEYGKRLQSTIRKENAAPMNMVHATDVQEILHQLKTDGTYGLSAEEAEKRIKEFGRNEIAKEQAQPWWKILLRQFKSPIVYLLLFAAAVSVYLAEWLDAGAIVIVIFVNAIIGFYMEFRAGRSMEALQKISSVATKALRNKRLSEVNA